MRSISYAGYTIDVDTVPRHIAVIMDGNGRWATSRGLTRSQGHKEGVKRIEDLIRFGCKYHIQEISLYTFSTENWNRPKQEISYLFRLVKAFFKQNMHQLQKQDVKIRVIGFDKGLSKEMLQILEQTMQLTKDCKTLTLNLCFNYGGHQDLVYATKAIVDAVKNGQIQQEDITESFLATHLKSALVSPVDLMIRTSNELRVSNFLPWQLAYAEFLFIPTHWPDFDEENFVKALLEYRNRSRRFGGIKP